MTQIWNAYSYLLEQYAATPKLNRKETEQLVTILTGTPNSLSTKVMKFHVALEFYHFDISFTRFGGMYFTSKRNIKFYRDTKRES
jgi:hypothetical protein